MDRGVSCKRNYGHSIYGTQSCVTGWSHVDVKNIMISLHMQSSHFKPMHKDIYFIKPIEPTNHRNVKSLDKLEIPPDNIPQKWKTPRYIIWVFINSFSPYFPYFKKLNFLEVIVFKAKWLTLKLSGKPLYSNAIFLQIWYLLNICSKPEKLYYIYKVA